MPNMLLTLKDLSFEVKGAWLLASIPDPYWAAKHNPHGENGLAWELEIETHGKEVEGETWAPSAWHNSLHFDVRRWIDIAGHTFDWQSAEGLNCGFYVFEHEDIPKGNLQFLRRDGRRFLVKWEGQCNVYWDEEYWEKLSFSVEAWADFMQIIVRGSGSDTDATMRDRLAQYLDPNDFVQHPIKSGSRTYDDGMAATSSLFEPIV